MEESCTSPPPSRDLAGGRTHARRRAAAPRACRGCLPVPLLRLPAPRPSAAAAKLKTLKPLQDAVEAPCPLAADCGSCMTKSLAYAAQIRHKHHQGRDTPRPACTPTSLPPTGSSMAPAPWPTAPRSAARRPADVLCCRRAALAGQRHYASRVRNHRLDVGMPVPSNVVIMPPLRVIGISCTMDMPRQPRVTLTDITNTSTSDQAGAVDAAAPRRQERNKQQRKRRSEMSDEQREEINRKQHEYRARKKAESNRTYPTGVLTPTMTSSTLAVQNQSHSANPLFECMNKVTT
ncbi:uncharacterized protein LOC120699098 isoform X1 [Panicum virgatum]|uniref:uncharacterized protein LOC120699098 isoform X1 n=1 Tax=Panicum virgatum TaxID=38727 RepID=UPI0019D61A68|nr:uncharacterized protein LOC120699098 isoform X1 [Panicum virgatum]